ncbi:hypothetical protein MASR2M78_02170 [Treponema sp.]
MTTRRVCIIFVLSSFLFYSCSINRMATYAVADVLSGTGSSSTVFTGEDDPQLVADALPFALKLYESVLSEAPDHQALGLATGSAFVMYANAFVEAPAEALPSSEYEQREKARARAKNLYLRGYAYLERGIEQKSPGLIAILQGDKDQKVEKSKKALSRFKKEDAGLLYWSGAALMAAYALDPFDFALGTRIADVRLFMARAYELDPDFGGSSIDDFYISFYGSLPPDLGGNVQKAEAHFNLALSKSKGLSASPYVSYATAIMVPRQDYPEFKRLLDTALAIDVNAEPGIRLVNLISQERAKRLLENAGDIFFDLGDDEAQE